MPTVIIVPKPLEMKTDAALYASYKDLDQDSFNQATKDMVVDLSDINVQEVVKAVNEDPSKLDDNVESLTSAYWLVRNISTALNVVKDEIKDSVKSALNATDRDSIDAPVNRLRFALSKSKETASYDIDAIKSERPDVWKLVAQKAPEPKLTDSERKELADKLLQLNEEMQSIEKQLVEDNASREECFNATLFDVIAEENKDLLKYRHSKKTAQKFYLKEMQKDAE